MQKAAKEKVLKLIFAIASVLFLCAPSTASSTSTSGLENRVELFLLGGENRTEPPAFGTANRVENYDSFWGTALESPVAPNSVVDKFRRTPNNLGEKLSMDEAMGGAGKKIMDGLNDPKFKGMEKWQHVHRNPDGTNTVIHYVRDPATGNLLDFKFK